VEFPLPWERLLWSSRTIRPPGAWYGLSDFRLVRVFRDRADEIVLHDIIDVQRTRSLLDRLIGTSTIVVHTRDTGRPPFVIHHVRRGQHLAALLDLLGTDSNVSVDAEAARAALSWEPSGARRHKEAIAGVAILLVAFFAVVIGLHGKAAIVAYPADDAVYPGGEKRDRESIVRFMEAAVLPWARETLGRLKGGPDRVSCETCHGRRPDERDWRMPAVAALPRPTVNLWGWERYSAGMDAQIRNAIYGYAAEPEKQGKADYMREVVLPGMARLLRRPAYDFTKTYDYNRVHFAFGCYHCHQVR